MAKQRIPCIIHLVLLVFLALLKAFVNASVHRYVSAVGDPGMRRDGLRLAIESWNQCNEVGDEVPQMGSPRAADCIDIYNASSTQPKGRLSNYKFLLLFSASTFKMCVLNTYKMEHLSFDTCSIVMFISIMQQKHLL